ncbi:hypothetical protein FG386_000507 [Cryptosporidium ryanae]|uniref:uncharacterized protein n=1 Tax=Cryptosporidium ryanae TaxID=515981 RepID=UPI00351A56B5|nr:hypothetical protein FG386_000507 [Cryptosporidium ryanae]
MENDPYSRVRKLKYKNIIKNPNRETGKTFSELEIKKGGSLNTDAENNNLGTVSPKISEKQIEHDKGKLIIKKGQGRIVSSNTTIKGFHTKFQQELKTGDMIEIEHPNTLITERREVINIASDRTLIIDKEFSSDLVSTTEYYVVSGNCVDEYKEKNNTILYREKNGLFKYKTVVKSVDSNLSREDVLDLRAKKQRDKYCWI